MRLVQEARLSSKPVTRRGKPSGKDAGGGQRPEPKGEKDAEAKKSSNGVQTVQFSVPNRMSLYLSTLPSKAMSFRNLKTMYDEMILRFLVEEPWLDGRIQWRQTKAKDDWVIVNVTLPTETVERMDDAAAAMDVSRASFLYTAAIWWVSYEYPPQRQGITTDA